MECNYHTADNPASGVYPLNFFKGGGGFNSDPFRRVWRGWLIAVQCSDLMFRIPYNDMLNEPTHAHTHTNPSFNTILYHLGYWRGFTPFLGKKILKLGKKLKKLYAEITQNRTRNDDVGHAV